MNGRFNQSGESFSGIPLVVVVVVFDGFDGEPARRRAFAPTGVHIKLILLGINFRYYTSRLRPFDTNISALPRARLFTRDVLVVSAVYTGRVKCIFYIIHVQCAHRYKYVIGFRVVA